MTLIKANFQRRDGDSGEKRKQKKERLYQLYIFFPFSSPVIWRRLKIPGKLTLKQFHHVIQYCFGWDDILNHQFYIGKIFYNSSSAADNEYYEDDVELQSVEEAMRWCFSYLYDDGSGGELNIVLEGAESKILGSEETIPVLIAGEGAVPPETPSPVKSYSESRHFLEKAGGQRPQQGSGVGSSSLLQIDIEAVNHHLRKMFAT